MFLWNRWRFPTNVICSGPRPQHSRGGAQTENELPQPQDDEALGLLTRK